MALVIFDLDQDLRRRCDSRHFHAILSTYARIDGLILGLHFAQQ
jgi:hypothetical protein